MKHYVNFALLFAFVTLVTSGVMRFVAPFDLATTRVHIVFGAAVLILVGLHLAARPRYFLKILRRRKPSADGPRPWLLLLAVLLSWASLLGASLWNWFPVPQLVSQSYESKNRATIFRPEQGTGFEDLGGGARLKRQAPGGANVLVEIEWGPAFEAEANFPKAFSGAKPQVAIWAESSAGSLIETFFVSEESAFAESLTWNGNPLRRVDILPIWRHRFTLVSGLDPSGEIDAYTGATPTHDFSVEQYLKEDSDVIYLCVEINAPNDENSHYNAWQPTTADGYMHEGLGQPSVFYSALLDPADEKKYYLMDFVGHGGSSNTQDGQVQYDASHLTTARELVEKILVRVVRK